MVVASNEHKNTNFGGFRMAGERQGPATEVLTESSVLERDRLRITTIRLVPSTARRLFYIYKVYN